MRVNAQSNTPRKAAITADRAITNSQSRVASWRVGHVTFRSSEKTSPKNPNTEKRLDGVSRRSDLDLFCAIGLLPSGYCVGTVPTLMLSSAFSELHMLSARRAVFSQMQPVAGVDSILLGVICV